MRDAGWGAQRHRPALSPHHRPPALTVMEHVAQVEQLLADVAFDVSTGTQETFTYRVPASLESVLAPGQLVEAPFGSRALQGVVLDVRIGVPGPFRLRDLVAIVDPVPCVMDYQISLHSGLRHIIVAH